MAEVSGAQVTKTGVVLSVAEARMTHVPNKKGKCLDVASNGDDLGPVNFAWSTTGYKISFKANIRSTPSSAARLITNNTNEILLTVNGIKVQHNGSSVTSNNVLIYDQWYDYDIEWDGEFVKYYRDGVLISSNYFTTAPSSTADDYCIFNRSDGLRNCDMKVAQLRWHNKSFGTENTLRMYRQNPNDTENLEFLYKLDEGMGSTATDSSSNGRDLTITGCSWSSYLLPSSEVAYFGATSVIDSRTQIGTDHLQNSGRNIVENPSFENNASWWSASGGATITRITTDSYIGSACGRLDVDGADGFTAIRVGATPTYQDSYRGRKFALSVYAKAGTINKMTLEYSKSSNTIQNFNLTSEWVRYTLTGTVPNNSTTQAIYIYAGTRGTSGIAGNIYIDAIDLVYFDANYPSSAIPLNYIDGNQADCSWEGTSGNSKSKRSVTNARLPSATRTLI